MHHCGDSTLDSQQSAASRRHAKENAKRRRADSIQWCGALRLVLHQGARGGDDGVGLTRFEGVFVSKSLGNHVGTEALAQQLSGNDEGLEVREHV